MPNKNRYKDPRIAVPILAALIGGIFLLISSSPQLPTSPIFKEMGVDIDTDGNYEISWESSKRATKYTLQEDMNYSFTSPRTVYGGSETKKYIYGKSDGDYYYRVRGCNDAGESDWSPLQKISVVPFHSATPTTTPRPTPLVATPTPIITSTPTTIPVVTSTITPAPATPKPSEEKFRVGPTVRLRPVIDIIEKKQDGIVELYIDNPSLNDVVLHMEVHVSVPSGIHIYSEEYAWATAAGVAYAPAIDVPPGTARTISLHIKADENARIGQHTLHFSGLYYPGNNKDHYNPISLTYPITVKELPTETPAIIPGFEAVLAVTGFYYME
jgi:hypothetical protein